ncbi:unnamed protein product, partial [Gadus morhua 'NCC']
ISLLDDGSILRSSCECPVGDFKCSHAAALAIFGMREVSVTDVECRWKRPASSKVSMPVSELYPQVEETYDALARDVTEEDMDWFRSEHCGTQCGMTCLLSPEPQPQPQHQALKAANMSLFGDNRRFLVWTTKEAIIIPIPKDSAWTQHLDVPEEFYRQHVLPVLEYDAWQDHHVYWMAFGHET